MLNLFGTLMSFAITGPEMLIRRSSGLGSHLRRETYIEADVEDVIETHKWRCVRTVNGSCLTFLYYFT